MTEATQVSQDERQGAFRSEFPIPDEGQHRRRWLRIPARLVFSKRSMQMAAIDAAAIAPRSAAASVLRACLIPVPGSAPYSLRT
jgi:hypothetical protein